MTTPMILLEQVSKAYGPHEILRDISFEVNPGEIVGLVGPNGTGKTTTIRLINGVIHPQSGRIVVDGRDPVKDGEAVRSLSGIRTLPIEDCRRMAHFVRCEYEQSLYYSR